MKQNHAIKTIIILNVNPMKRNPYIFAFECVRTAQQFVVYYLNYDN